jgi:hypothetical protein
MTTTIRTPLVDHMATNDYQLRDARSLPRGFENGQATDVFDLDVRSTGVIRVVIFPNDGERVDVHAMDRFRANLWSISFSSGTPSAVIVAALTSAERFIYDALKANTRVTTYPSGSLGNVTIPDND